MTDDEIRQARREAQEWQNDAQALRRELTNAGMSTRDFDAMMNDLKALDNPQAYVDPANLAALQAQALDKVKNLEFTLRKKIDGADQPLKLSGSDEVPAGFRDSIDAYFKALAKKQ